MKCASVLTANLALVIAAVVQVSVAETINFGTVYRTGSLSTTGTPASNGFPQFLADANPTTLAWNLNGPTVNLDGHSVVSTSTAGIAGQIAFTGSPNAVGG